MAPSVCGMLGKLRDLRFGFPQKVSGFPCGVTQKEDTPPKINRESENDGLENDFPFQTGDF